MGKMTIVLPDELEERLRRYLFTQTRKGYRIKYGEISGFIAQAVERELDRLEGSEAEKEA